MFFSVLVRFNQEKSGTPDLTDDHLSVSDAISVFDDHFHQIVIRKRRSSISAGLPDFASCNKLKRGKNLPNYHKMYQRAIKYTIWP
jgi:hypothetical protein